MEKKRIVASIGLDAHRKFSKVAARNPAGELIWRQRMDHRDRRMVRQQMRSWPAGTPVILEATFGWGWITDELQACGQQPHLAHSGKVSAWREARGLAKNDDLDASLLSELWFQRPPWWEVWRAPTEGRTQREWLRYRCSLVKMQTALKNRIHAIMHRHGIVHEFSDLFGVEGRQYLQFLAEPNNITLPDSARAMLKGYLQLLDHVRRQIAGVTMQFRRQLKRDANAQRLKTLPGVGEVLAYTIMAEIGCIERFAKPRSLAAYSLVAPRDHESAVEWNDGESPRGRHVGHAGRRTLKWAWIEAAHGAVKGSSRFHTIFDRRTNGGKRDRQRGYIAVAHELCRTAYAMLKRSDDYREDRPVRPGTRVPTDSRSGMGQPDHPMVVAAS